MKQNKNLDILTGSNFSSKSNIVYSEYISRKEYLNKNSTDKLIIFNEEKYLLYKLTEFELFENAIIFCNNILLKSLFKQLNKVTDFKNIKLITHQTDQLIDEEIFNLKPDCISKWFSINVGYDHPDLVPIPLGLGNDFQDNQINSSDIEDNYLFNKEQLHPHLYLNFKESTNFKERKNLYEYFSNADWVTIENPNLLKSQYKEAITKSSFILCPWGNGIDTHRLWESLYYGKIPITKYHHTYSYLNNLPILFVDKYEDITQEGLIDFIYSLKSSDIDYKKLSIETWIDLISQIKVESSYKVKINENYISNKILKFKINIHKKLSSKLKIYKYYLKQVNKKLKKIYHGGNQLR
ncbi:hypothetical protein N9309_02565 [Acidimicrobiia bacterium]|nr:hypothetical protein [Acidimicrobiia bacterium]